MISFERLSHYSAVTLKGNMSPEERLMYNNSFIYLIFIHPQILCNRQVSQNITREIKKNKSKLY